MDEKIIGVHSSMEKIADLKEIQKKLVELPQDKLLYIAGAINALLMNGGQKAG